MNIGDKIIWRYNNKKTWKKSEVTHIFANQLIELKLERDFIHQSETVIVKLTEIEYEVI